MWRPSVAPVSPRHFWGAAQHPTLAMSGPVLEVWGLEFDGGGPAVLGWPGGLVVVHTEARRQPGPCMGTGGCIEVG